VPKAKTSATAKGTTARAVPKSTVKSAPPTRLKTVIEIATISAFDGSNGRGKLAMDSGREEDFDLRFVSLEDDDYLRLEEGTRVQVTFVGAKVEKLRSQSTASAS
jgi:cold shock CspA family protein